MEFKYIAMNGDDVGSGIGNAIATDNHEELSKITGGLKDAHSAIEEWATSKGGQVVTSSGDECIVKIPSGSYDESELDSIKDQYSDTSGHSVTMGLGDSMSEASKALIYGKMNDKDQIVEYDTSIDDYIANYDESSSLEDEDSENDMMQDAQEGEEEEQYNDDSFDASEMADDEEDQISPEMGDEDEMDEMEGQDMSEGMEELQGEDEELALQGESPNEETQELPAEGSEENLMQEGEMSEEDMAQDSEDILNEFTEEEGMEEMAVPKDQIDGDYGSEEMAAAQPEHEQAMGEEEEFIHDAEENRSDEMDADNIEADMEGQDPAMMEEGMEDNQGALQDMIHANMGEEEGEQASPEELKERVASILVSFKENKTALEMMKQSNPKMYQSSIGMLESMIEMAKMLNMNPEKDAAAMEAKDGLPDADIAGAEEGQEMPEEAMQADMEEEANDAEAEMAGEEEAAPEKKKRLPFQKSEKNVRMGAKKKSGNIVRPKLKSKGKSRPQKRVRPNTVKPREGGKIHSEEGEASGKKK